MSIGFEDLVPMGRRGLIQATNIVTITLVVTLATLRLIVLGLHYVPVPAIIVVVGGICNAIYIRRQGSLDTAAWILVGLLLIGLFYGGLNTGGFSGPVIMLAPLISIYTMLLIDSAKAWLSLLLVCLVLGALFALDLNGYIAQGPRSSSEILLGRFITMMTLCLASTLVVWSFARITHELLARIERQSVTDYLTGILNRRGVEAILLSEVGRARRVNGWLSVIITDVDRFKLYNDTNGHQDGDRCLVAIAQLIASCSERTSDVVGRFGGEEFVAILPDTNPEGAVKVAEKMRRGVLAKNMAYGPDDPGPVSLTFGVVSARGHAIESVEQLIRQADAALYSGKHQGRNRVVSVILGKVDKSASSKVVSL